MRVLIGCEFSGRVRDAFAARGHDAWSCDLRPSTTPGQHIQGDVLEAVAALAPALFIVHPPCTYLCSSGLHWNGRVPGRQDKTEEALRFVEKLFALDSCRMAVENPIGCIGTRLRRADQIIQPHQFGDDAAKATCLWLFGLPKLIPTKHIPPRMVNGRPRWSNQTDSGQNRLGPSPDRAAIRATTYPGIAAAMAEQWGNL